MNTIDDKINKENPEEILKRFENMQKLIRQYPVKSEIVTPLPDKWYPTDMLPIVEGKEYPWRINY
jgi:hypothetical protein